MWHAQITSLTLRDLQPPNTFENKDPYEAVAQVEFLERGAAFVHGALRTNGKPLSIRQWRDLGRLLRDDYGVMRIDAERKGERISYDTVRL